jgi:hypothetical protein
MMLAWSLVEAGRASEAATELRALPRDAGRSEVQATLATRSPGRVTRPNAIGRSNINVPAPPGAGSPYSALGDDDALVQLAERAVATRLTS